ncbi:hypothetical protein Arad_3837 [Rhizobium rhizogenes K84]|uniref:Uncharacterized protein n=1 Tax=Rhizobium rhizogenes (strain K84 / ATCC BAA-868) TaxID=311403 RepID=B9JA77_RHIR8|nr:hypothetical protein Arad_3837 [Rhizobium rhizogenes K84]
MPSQEQNGKISSTRDGRLPMLQISSKKVSLQRIILFVDCLDQFL